MGTIEIKVSDYYDKPKFYAYMPEEIFNALEAAFIAGEKTAIVPKLEFDLMLKNISYEQEEKGAQNHN